MAAYMTKVIPKTPWTAYMMKVIPKTPWRRLTHVLMLMLSSSFKKQQLFGKQQ
jgi:hypothetical protein